MNPQPPTKPEQAAVPATVIAYLPTICDIQDKGPFWKSHIAELQ
jgi:hypothetical protein